MKRLHLFEFEDLPWFPASLRDMMTDLLGLTIEVGRLYHPVLPLLAKALQTTGDRSILDLCSGGGGPVPGLRRRLAKDYGLAVEVQLSDFYPNVGAFQRIVASQESGLTFVPTPIDPYKRPDLTPLVRASETIGKVLKKGDIVFCKVKSHFYLHLVSAVQGDRVQISNNKGHVNGWITRNGVYGRCIEIAP